MGVHLGRMLMEIKGHYNTGNLTMRNITMGKKFLLIGVFANALLLSGCISAPVVLASAAGTGAANSAGSSVAVPQQVDDFKIRSQIYTDLYNTKGLDGANIEVTVFNGIVLLLGQVPTDNLRQQIASQVSTINGVVVVYNQFTVGPNERVTQYTSDSWLTTKVIAAIAKKANSLHFKVVTQSGVVYLLGQVTQAEADVAVAQAQQVNGVKSIVKIFNYIAPSEAQPEVVPIQTATPVANNAPVSSVPATTAPAASNSSASVPQYAPDYGSSGNGAGSAGSD